MAADDLVVHRRRRVLGQDEHPVAGQPVMAGRRQVQPIRRGVAALRTRQHLQRQGQVVGGARHRPGRRPGLPTITPPPGGP